MHNKSQIIGWSILFFIISLFFSYITISMRYDISNIEPFPFDTFLLLSLLYALIITMTYGIYYYFKYYFPCFYYFRKNNFTQMLKWFDENEKQKQITWEFYLLSLFFTGNIQQFKEYYPTHTNEIQERNTIYRYILYTLFRLIRTSEFDKTHICLLSDNKKIRCPFHKNIYQKFYFIEKALQYYDEKEWAKVYQCIHKSLKYDGIDAKPLTFYVQMLLTKTQKYYNRIAFDQSLQYLYTLCFNNDTKRLIANLFEQEYHQLILEENNMNQNNQNNQNNFNQNEKQNDKPLQRTFTYRNPKFQQQNKQEPTFVRNSQVQRNQTASFTQTHANPTIQNKSINNTGQTFDSTWFIREKQNDNQQIEFNKHSTPTNTQINSVQQRPTMSRTMRMQENRHNTRNDQMKQGMSQNSQRYTKNQVPFATQQIKDTESKATLSRAQYQTDHPIQKNNIPQGTIPHANNHHSIAMDASVPNIQVSKQQESTFQHNVQSSSHADVIEKKEAIEKIKNNIKEDKKSKTKQTTSINSKQYLKTQLHLFMMILVNSVIISFVSSSIVYTSFFNRYSINSEMINEIVLLSFIVALFMTYAAVSLHTGFTIFKDKISNLNIVLKIITSPFILILCLISGMIIEVPYIIYHSIKASGH